MDYAGLRPPRSGPEQDATSEVGYVPEKYPTSLETNRYRTRRRERQNLSKSSGYASQLGSGRSFPADREGFVRERKHLIRQQVRRLTPQTYPTTYPAICIRNFRFESQTGSIAGRCTCVPQRRPDIPTWTETLCDTLIAASARLKRLPRASQRMHKSAHAAPADAGGGVAPTEAI